MANTDRARKLLIRTALATSSTIATLFGAQNLALLDGASFQQIDTQTVSDTGVSDTPQTDSTLTINTAAPSFVILRHASTDSTQLNQATNMVVVQPPLPNQIAIVPEGVQQSAQTIVVQQPVRQRTRSSR